jgi:hypothetical protein
MLLFVDGTGYRIELSKYARMIKVVYEMSTTTGIPMKDGSRFYINPTMKSFLKLIATPVLIPMLRNLYLERGLKLEPPVRHEDLMEYFIENFVRWIEQVEGRLSIDATTSETDENSYKTVIGATTTWKDAQKENRVISGNSTEKEPSDNYHTRGETLASSWQNGHGENLPHEGHNTA